MAHLLCGISAANVSTLREEKSAFLLTEDLIRALFLRAPWPESYRLYYVRQKTIRSAIGREANEAHWRVAGTEGEARAILASFNDLTFAFGTEPLDEPKPTWLLRPSGIAYALGSQRKTVILRWEPPSCAPVVTLGAIPPGT